MYIELIVGPMFSRKTSSLLRKTEEVRLQYPDSKILYIIHSLDRERKMLSHSFIFDQKQSHLSVIDDFLYIQKLEEFEPKSDVIYGAICIDEAQFFEDLDVFVKKNNNRQNIKNIFIAGLDGSCKMEKFSGSKIYDILPYCDTFSKNNALCKICLNNNIRVAAPFTKLDKGVVKELPENDILIGGGSMFYPVCRNHYFEGK